MLSETNIQCPRCLGSRNPISKIPIFRAVTSVRDTISSLSKANASGTKAKRGMEASATLRRHCDPLTFNGMFWASHECVWIATCRRATVLVSLAQTGSLPHLWVVREVMFKKFELTITIAVHPVVEKSNQIWRRVGAFYCHPTCRPLTHHRNSRCSPWLRAILHLVQIQLRHMNVPRSTK